MSQFQFSKIWPEDFCGLVKLFPLPNLVLFPHIVQPLHIFEPRYCDLLSDALSSDSLIAMALLQSNWETNYENRPEIASYLCVGKIISHTPTEDGRHNILLVGARRAKIIREIDSDTRYRMAEVKIIEDSYPEDDSSTRLDLAVKLQELFLKFVPDGAAAQESFRQLLGRKLPLGVLTDTISYAMNLPVAIKLQLLAEENVDIRCRLLTRCLEQKLGVDGFSPDAAGGDSILEFPPPFSEN